MHAEPVSRSPLYDQVVERLRRLLIEGRIPPGSKLNERLLSERLHVSRTPLREAFKLLAKEGLIQSVPYRGAFAARANGEQVLDAFEVLMLLADASARRAADRLGDDDIASIARSYEALHRRCERHDRKGFAELSIRICCAICNAANNATLVDVFGDIASRVKPMWESLLVAEDDLALRAREHATIVAACRGRDPGKLAVAMRVPLSRIRDRMRACLARDGDDATLTAEQVAESNARAVDGSASAAAVSMRTPDASTRRFAPAT